MGVREPLEAALRVWERVRVPSGMQLEGGFAGKTDSGDR